MKRDDTLNYYLASYIAIGYHQPKKMPKKTYTEQKIAKAQTEEEMMKMAQRITKALGGEVK